MGDVYSRSVGKAAELLGGASRLAARLDLSVGTVRMMMNGKVDVPPRIFLLVVDIISAHDAPADKSSAGTEALNRIKAG